MKHSAELKLNHKISNKISYCTSNTTTTTTTQREVENTFRLELTLVRSCGYSKKASKPTKQTKTLDTNRLVYSLLGAHDASFSIESHTGLLRVSRPLDREVKSTHTLTVLVTDGSRSQSSVPFTSSATFTIQLLDVNDSPPQFVNTSAHRIKISELARVGERLTRLKAISQDEGDNAVIHYRLLTKQPEFGLNETTGKLFYCII
ncbi:unnamed protein product [Trichobilharzia regenti]|nr:unnamed protein product [Trichobilharzia regenti]